MIVSLYKELTQFEGVGGDMVSRIRTLGVSDVFKPLESYKGADGKPVDMDVFNKILFWVLHCYSRESKKDIIGADWQRVKVSVAKELKMPEDVIADVVKVEDWSIRETIMNYLEYQDYRTYKHLKTLKDQYDQMLSASLKMLTKGEALDVDYIMKYKCGEYADLLLERIKSYEDKLKDDLRDIGDAVEEVERKSNRKLGTSLSVDANEYIKD
jgi:hypothetical protein